MVLQEKFVLILNAAGSLSVSLLQPDYLACLLATDTSRDAESVGMLRNEPNELQNQKNMKTARKYVETNKEHIRNLKRKHQAEHPEKYEEASRRYLETNREKVNDLARERRQQDLEHYREIGRNSYERHAEDRRKYSLEYYKRFPEKSVAATNRRRALKLSAKGTHTEKEWQDLKAFYNFKCLKCGKQEPEIKLTRDHVIPLTQGGSDSIDNVQPLCARCNSKKNNKHIDYR